MNILFILLTRVLSVGSRKCQLVTKYKKQMLDNLLNNTILDFTFVAQLLLTTLFHWQAIRIFTCENSWPCNHVFYILKHSRCNVDFDWTSRQDVLDEYTARINNSLISARKQHAIPYQVDVRVIE